MKEALHFGGGKDSLACLYLLRDKWPDLYVVWMNTGAAFPETLKQMEEIKQLVPNFIEVKSDVISDIARHGYPADIVPTRNTPIGRHTTGEELKIRAWSNCCWANMWLPMQQKMEELDVKVIYRGQRASEEYKSPVQSGDLVNGTRYIFPIYDWNDEKLRTYLKKQKITLPPNYQYMNTSLDCWCCTAYLDTKSDQVKYMKEFHKDKHKQVIRAIRDIYTASLDAIEYGSELA